MMDEFTEWFHKENSDEKGEHYIHNDLDIKFLNLRLETSLIAWKAAWEARKEFDAKLCEKIRPPRDLEKELPCERVLLAREIRESE